MGVKSCIKTADSDASAMEALVKDYVADLKHDPNNQSSRLILAHRRKDVAKLNSAVRQSLIARGKLKDQQKYETVDGMKRFASGDRILFTKNDNDLGVKNGTLGTVLKTNEQSITIQPDDKKAQLIVVDLEAYNSLDHGYAVTIHKSQGATVDKTWLFATRTMDQHLMYVAGTRHTTDFKIHAEESYEINQLHKTQNKLVSTDYIGVYENTCLH